MDIEVQEEEEQRGRGLEDAQVEIAEGEEFAVEEMVDINAPGWLEE